MRILYFIIFMPFFVSAMENRQNMQKKSVETQTDTVQQRSVETQTDNAYITLPKNLFEHVLTHCQGFHECDDLLYELHQAGILIERVWICYQDGTTPAPQKKSFFRRLIAAFRHGASGGN